MQIFIYEYTCASPSWSSLPSSLRAEGQAMLTALLEDFATIDGVQTTTLLAKDFPGTLAHRCCRNDGDEQAIFCELAQQADYALVIAPEFDEILTTRCQWLETGGCRSLNCALPAMALTADKLTLAEHLHQHGIPTPVTAPFEQHGFPSLARQASIHPSSARQASIHSSSPSPSLGDGTNPSSPSPRDGLGHALPSKPKAQARIFPLVCKPRYGAGSQDTFLLHQEADLAKCMDMLRQRDPVPEMILQSFHPGLPVSVAFLIGPNQCLPLIPAEQRLADDGSFGYLGGRLPLPSLLAERAIALAERAVASVAGLGGYVGVDLVLGAAADGNEDALIEINPRLTTSYIGLRRLCKDNLAQALWQIVHGDKVELVWKNEMISFDAVGAALAKP